MAENVFTFQYITAIIYTALNTARAVNIKYKITSDMWIGIIHNMPYLFHIPHGRETYTWAMRAALTSRITLYDIRKSRHIPSKKWNMLRDRIIQISGEHSDIDVMDILRDTFSFLKHNDVDVFTPTLRKITSKKLRSKIIHDDVILNIIHGLVQDGYAIKPTPRTTHMISDSIQVQSPATLGAMCYCAVELATNKPMLTKKKHPKPVHMVVYIALVMFVVLAAVYVWYGVDTGILVIPGMEPGSSVQTTGGVNPCDPKVIQDTYETTLEVAVALETGELACSIHDIPDPLHTMIRSEDPALVQWAIDQNNKQVNTSPLDNVVPDSIIPEVMP